MRVGIDARLWGESGVGRYIRNLVLNLQILDRKNEYVLFVRNKDAKEIQNLVQNDSFRIVRADIRWHTLDEQLRFSSVLNKENLDLVHFPYFSVPIFYNRPFVVTIHDLILHHFPTGEASTLPWPVYQIKLLGYKLVISQAAKKAQKIITVSNATKQEIIDHLGVDEDKIVVTYEGVTLASSHQRLATSSKNAITKRYTLDASSYFLYVGNAYPHKNLERFLQALNILVSQYPDISLVLVGKEDYFYKRLKEKIKQINLQNRVTFYGEANDQQLVALYKNAKALVLPSLMEGFGLPALEAMANKCLVLASDIPALREICEDAAIYFDPYNIDDLYQKMKEANSNDMYYYSDNIKRGVDRMKMFSWEKMAKETLKVYNSLK